MKTEKELRKTLKLLDWFERMPCPEMTDAEQMALSCAVGMLRWVLGETTGPAALTDELIRGAEKLRRDVAAALN